MMSLLIPIGEGEEGLHALRSAALLACRVGAHADVIFVPGDMAAVASHYDAAPEGIRRQAMAQLAEERADEARHAEQAFGALMRDHGVAMADEPAAGGGATASWRRADGSVEDAVQRWAGIHDAIVFARGGAGGGSWRENVEAALFGSGRPILLVPGRELASLGEHVMIGWNRSPQSARAASDALPILRHAGRVTVLCVTTGAKPGPSAAEAAEWLARHGVAADAVEVPPGENGVGQQLLDEAQARQADLLVIGAYSHSRLRESLFGGVTRHLLGHADLPVFMAH